MTTINEFKESMTIFYSKNTGIIRSISSGIQDMSVYADLQEDMSIIQDYLVLPFGKDLFENKQNYKVDLEAKTVIKIMTSQADIEIANIKEGNKIKNEKIQALEDESVKIKIAMADIYESMLGGE